MYCENNGQTHGVDCACKDRGWTPEVYIRLIDVDLKDLQEEYKAVRFALATGGDLRYAVGRLLHDAGKVQDNAKLLHISLNRAT